MVAVPPTYTLPPVADLSRDKTPAPAGWSPHSNYASSPATQQVLHDTGYLLGVRPWHLGQLLGLPSTNKIYRWTSGKQRPCTLYMTRLLQLVILHVVHGWRFIDIRSIDWETREVFPRKVSHGKDKNNLPVSEWTFPNTMGQDQFQLPNGGPQPPG